MELIRGTLKAAPLWGRGLFGSLLALIGVAPFALFMSEFQILKAASHSGAIWALILFLAGTSVVFVAALRHALAMAWGKPEKAPVAERTGYLDAAVVLLPLVALLILGLWMPAPMENAITQAAAIIGGGR
jgi:hydrogenase-4 component F